MLKKFYIVQDQKDLLSGGIIPTKVLNQMPIGALYPMSPIVQPMPIRKSGELVVNGYSPSMSPLFSRSVSPIMSPYSPMSITRSFAPLSPVLSRTVAPSPFVNTNSYVGPWPRPYGTYGPPYGPPIIKRSYAAERGEKAKMVIEELNDSSNKDSFEIHLGPIIDIVDLIQKETGTPVSLTPPTAPPAASTGAPPAAAEVVFKVSIPGNSDFYWTTTRDKKVAIVKKLKEKYEDKGVSYLNSNGDRELLNYYINRLRVNPYYAQYFRY